MPEMTFTISDVTIVDIFGRSIYIEKGKIIIDKDNLIIKDSTTDYILVRSFKGNLKGGGWACSK